MTDRILFQPQYRYNRASGRYLLDANAQGKLPPLTQEIFFGPRPAEEFYELGKDPDEINNLANDPAYASELQRHREILDAWILETDDKGQYTSLDADGNFKKTTWKEKKKKSKSKKASS